MATGKIPCGIAIPQTIAPTDVRFMRDFLTRAEALGYDSLWVQEQILGDAPMLEPITLLTFAAALTSKVRLGTSVILPITRNPIHLAKALSSLDQLSQGRVTLGVGMGGPHVPEPAFGISKENRSRRFVEVMKVTEGAVDQPRARHSPASSGNSRTSRWSPSRFRSRIRRSGSARATRSRSSARCAMATDGWARVRRRPRISSSKARCCVGSSRKRSATRRSFRSPSASTSRSMTIASAPSDACANGSASATKMPTWRRAFRFGAASPKCVDKLGELVRAGAQHFLLNPVFDDMEHLEKLASEVMPRL